MHPLQKKMSAEMAGELIQILSYWSTSAIDHTYGGFLGERDFYNTLVPEAPKGIILNSRILWSFSAASNHLQTNEYKALCDRSFLYLQQYFRDEKYGGVYWELDYQGRPVNLRKQVYAQAFMIYALSEYFIFSKNPLALQWALEIYCLIEKYANDRKFGGYTEAFARDWSNIEDMRLSEKDANEAKTMNTHLHVLEAYTNLYRVHREKALENQLRFLIEKFLNTFYDNKTKHFNLFFNEQWQVKGQIISYGHDIEAAWLLIEAAKVIQDKNLIILTSEAAMQIADTFMDEALGKDGGVCNEFNPETGILDTDKHWWPQVEAIIGLNYAWQLSKEEKYLLCAVSIWEFTKKNIIDRINGEWHWRVNSKGEPSTTDYKMGMWKAPYHNSRACIQMNRPIDI